MPTENFLKYLQNQVNQANVLTEEYENYRKKKGEAEKARQAKERIETLENRTSHTAIPALKRALDDAVARKDSASRKIAEANKKVEEIKKLVKLDEEINSLSQSVNETQEKLYNFNNQRLTERNVTRAERIASLTQENESCIQAIEAEKVKLAALDINFANLQLQSTAQSQARLLQVLLDNHQKETDPNKRKEIQKEILALPVICTHEAIPLNIQNNPITTTRFKEWDEILRKIAEETEKFEKAQTELKAFEDEKNQLKLSLEATKKEKEDREKRQQKIKANYSISPNPDYPVLINSAEAGVIDRKEEAQAAEDEYTEAHRKYEKAVKEKTDLETLTKNEASYQNELQALKSTLTNAGKLTVFEQMEQLEKLEGELHELESLTAEKNGLSEKKSKIEATIAARSNSPTPTVDEDAAKTELERQIAEVEAEINIFHRGGSTAQRKVQIETIKKELETAKKNLLTLAETSTTKNLIADIKQWEGELIAAGKDKKKIETCYAKIIRCLEETDEKNINAVDDARNPGNSKYAQTQIYQGKIPVDKLNEIKEYFRGFQAQSLSKTDERQERGHLGWMANRIVKKPSLEEKDTIGASKNKNLEEMTDQEFYEHSQKAYAKLEEKLKEKPKTLENCDIALDTTTNGVNVNFGSRFGSFSRDTVAGALAQLDIAYHHKGKSGMHQLQIRSYTSKSSLAELINGFTQAGKPAIISRWYNEKDKEDSKVASALFLNEQFLFHKNKEKDAKPGEVWFEVYDSLKKMNKTDVLETMWLTLSPHQLELTLPVMKEKESAIYSDQLKKIVSVIIEKKIDRKALGQYIAGIKDPKLKEKFMDEAISKLNEGSIGLIRTKNFKAFAAGLNDDPASLKYLINKLHDDQGRVKKYCQELLGHGKSNIDSDSETASTYRWGRTSSGAMSD